MRGGEQLYDYQIHKTLGAQSRSSLLRGSSYTAYLKLHGVGGIL